MKKYVKCRTCEWQLENNPDRNWDEIPCNSCKNTREVIDPKDILCNMCGESMCPIGTMNEQIPHGLHNVKIEGGYDSYHLLDMTQYTFSFCEKCLRQMFMACKIKPEVSDFNFNEIPLDFEQDQISYEYRVWVDNGWHHQAYLNKKCNAIKDCPNTAIFTLLHDDKDFTENTFCEEHKNKAYFNSNLVKFIPNVLKSFL